MNTRLAIGAFLALACGIVIATLVYSFFQRNSTPEPSPLLEEELSVGFIPDIITARHQYKNGVHTVVGQVDMPTPCDLLETDAVVRIDEPHEDKATVQFSMLNDDETCTQVITPARFKVRFSAGADARIDALWNGTAVRLNLVPVGPGENIDDFEIYFKG